MDPTSSALIVAPVTNDTISITAFYVLAWFFFGLCTIAFAIRVYIRYICFHRLLLEDYLMLFALAIHNAEVILIQLYVRYAYELEAVQKGKKMPGPSFFPEVTKGLVAIGACVNLTIVGVLIVKINFLLFFRRLTSHLPKFAIIWWAVLIFAVGGAAAQIGMQEFGCFFGGADYIFTYHCTGQGTKRIFLNAIFSAVVDAVSDVLIIGFPVAILWSSRISMRKKLVLTFIFCLVFLTISITIVRGSIFHSVYSADSSEVGQIQSPTFTWFWFYIEFSVAYIIACMVSFRTLFVQQERNSEKRIQIEQQLAAARQEAAQGGWHRRARHMYDSVLDTLKSLEGSPSDRSGVSDRSGLPIVPSGLMTVDFNDDANWGKALPGKQHGTETVQGKPPSVEELQPDPLIIR
ncbi:hypothetical protein F4809DRAFT_235431 [Biscogniauxia mediterranea]|nr:hypothetical protein F4809DRAFT_235431 [Biscogniauxia mediterranea]